MERMIHPIIVAMRLVLASASPRRAELLSAAGFQFETQTVDLDERVRPGEAPEEYVRRLAIEKSACALEILSDVAPPEAAMPPNLSLDSGRIVVLAADTAVVVDGTILGKPAGDQDARLMLRRLSGRAHQVMTGVSLRASSCESSRVETTVVEFLPMTDEEISWYVESGEGRDKAGAYAIQGLASRFIPRIEGSYSNVVGLPIATVYELLDEIASQR
jgi:septum formation protein